VTSGKEESRNQKAEGRKAGTKDWRLETGERKKAVSSRQQAVGTSEKAIKNLKSKINPASSP
jgi:hypothetical protein